VRRGNCGYQDSPSAAGAAAGEGLDGPFDVC
jgi:hypothetical protein